MCMCVCVCVLFAVGDGSGYFLWCCFCTVASDIWPCRMSLRCLSTSPSIRANACVPTTPKSSSRLSSSELSEWNTHTHTTDTHTHTLKQTHTQTHTLSNRHTHTHSQTDKHTHTHTLK